MKVKVEERMRPGSAHTADLAIRYKDILWYVDVQVPCPATAAQVNEGSHLVEGTAADRAYQRKLAKYAPVLGGVRNREGQLESVQNFQPFIVETGGLVHRKSIEWLDALLVDAPRALAKCYSIVMETLDRNHGKMLSMFKGFDDFSFQPQPNSFSSAKRGNFIQDTNLIVAHQQHAAHTHSTTCS